MSKTGADGTEDQEIDPHEQTETRTRAPSAVDDDNWDLGEPVVTKVASIPPPAVTTQKVENNSATESKQLSLSASASPTLAGRAVNPSKFPSAMAELSKSEPKVLSAPKTETAPVFPKPNGSPNAVSGDSNAVIVAAPIITVERGSSKSEGKLAVVKDVQTTKSESKFPVAKDVQTAKSESKFPVAKDVQTTKSEGKFPVAKDVQTTKSEGKFPVAKDVHSAKSEGKFSVSPSIDSHDEKRPSSANIKAPRERQESFLSLESEHVVEFFSSPPASGSGSGYADYEPEIELTPPPRSLFPAAELKQRRRHFRAIVVKVMLVALALFAFSLYVFWRRGLFDQLGF
jgi:hypothetical protein